MNRKTQGIVAAAVALGVANSEDFSGGGVVQTLKELAVATGCADNVSEIEANQISGVLNYIAENGESVVYPEPTGTKTITENGTHDVKDYESAEVAVPAASWNGTLSITNQSITLQLVFPAITGIEVINLPNENQETIQAPTKTGRSGEHVEAVFWFNSSQTNHNITSTNATVQYSYEEVESGHYRYIVFVLGNSTNANVSITTAAT